MAPTEPLAWAFAQIERLGAGQPTGAPAPLPERIGTFWSGSTLPPAHGICMRSWTALGLPAELFAYEDVSGVPEGIILRDAGEILPLGRIPGGRETVRSLPHVTADIFRLALMEGGGHVWCDTDAMLLRPLPPARTVFMGREPNGHVCNAVLWIDPESGIPQRILSTALSRAMPRWSHGRAYGRAIKRALRGKRRRLDDYPMHQWGRHALEYLVTARRLEDELLAPDSFYHPACYDDSLTRADWPVERVLETEELLGLHFFWKHEARIAEAAPGSFWHWARERFGPS